MIDISGKAVSLRTARAQSVLKASPATLDRVRAGTIPKGNPLETARVAAVMAAKNACRIIPDCHPMPLEFVGVEFSLLPDRIDVNVTVKAIYRTGVEMEALTAAAAAALTLYDMMKMIDKDMEILSVRLIEKKGGRSDPESGGAAGRALRAAVVVASDSAAAGGREDGSGRLAAERLQREGFDLVERCVIPDDRDAIVRALTRLADEVRCDLVLTTGGTGLGPRDNTPEATAAVIDRDAAGIIEAVRAFGQERTARAMLSRGRAGVRGGTLIVNLPGSERGVAESLDALFPALLHAFPMMRGGGHA